MDADHNLLIIPFVLTRRLPRSSARPPLARLFCFHENAREALGSSRLKLEAHVREAQPLTRRPSSRNKRREVFKKVEFSFNRCPQPRPPLWFPSLSESFLPLWVTGDHVSPLDLCSNMDEEMRETRAHDSFLYPRLPPTPAPSPIASVSSIASETERRGPCLFNRTEENMNLFP